MSGLLSRCLSISGAAGVLRCCSSSDRHWQSAPATIAEAGNVLNLATIPLADGAEPPRRRNLASLSYKAPGDATKVFRAHCASRS